MPHIDGEIVIQQPIEEVFGNRFPGRQGTSVPPRPTGATPTQRNHPRAALVTVDAFAAATAIWGGLALATGVEGDRFPTEWLRGTPFRNYRVPGLLLAGLVGGSATAATVATLRNPRGGGLASLLAGLVLMGWIGGEIRLLKQPAYYGTWKDRVFGTWTERFFFVVGLLMAVLGWRVGRADLYFAEGVAPRVDPHLQCGQRL
jgi:hypothetical protein